MAKRKRYNIYVSDEELIQKIEKFTRRAELSFSEFFISAARESFSIEEQQWSLLFKRLDQQNVLIKNSSEPSHIMLELLNFYIWHQMALTPNPNYSEEEKKQLAVSADQRQKRFLDIFKARYESKEVATSLWDKMKDR